MVSLLRLPAVERKEEGDHSTGKLCTWANCCCSRRVVVGFSMTGSMRQTLTCPLHWGKVTLDHEPFWKALSRGREPGMRDDGE